MHINNIISKRTIDQLEEDVVTFVAYAATVAWYPSPKTPKAPPPKAFYFTGPQTPRSTTRSKTRPTRS